jgi:hypothetical protein
VAVEHLAPAPVDGEAVALPPALGRTLGAQLDLERLEGVNDAVTIYRNDSWAPIRLLVPDSIDPVAAGGIASFAHLDLTTARPALLDVGDDGVSARGAVPSGARISVATTAAHEWRLEVDGRAAPRSDGFGWANVFAVDEGGDATLHTVTPLRRRLLLMGQATAWVVAFLALGSLRHRRTGR